MASVAQVLLALNCRTPIMRQQKLNHKPLGAGLHTTEIDHKPLGAGLHAPGVGWRAKSTEAAAAAAWRA
jgi:hypothetical protein